MVVTVMATIVIATFFIALFVFLHGDISTVGERLMSAGASALIALVVGCVCLIAYFIIASVITEPDELAYAEMVPVQSEFTFDDNGIKITYDDGHSSELRYGDVDVVCDLDESQGAALDIYRAENKDLLKVESKYVLHVPKGTNIGHKQRNE